eukprot:8108981-Pyramimonas_sp.AAC.1
MGTQYNSPPWSLPAGHKRRPTTKRRGTLHRDQVEASNGISLQGYKCAPYLRNPNSGGPSETRGGPAERNKTRPPARCFIAEAGPRLQRPSPGGPAEARGGHSR